MDRKPRHPRHSVTSQPGEKQSRATKGPSRAETTSTRETSAGRVDAAQAWARERCSANQVKSWRTFPGRTGAVFVALWAAFGFGRDPLPGEGPGYVISEAAGWYLWRTADSCSDCYELAVTLARQNITYGRELPEGLRTLVCMMLDGSCKRPKSQGRYRSKNWKRDLTVVRTIELMVEKFQVRPMRNDATPDKDSACDIVSDAFVRAGAHELTYKAVKTIWINKTLKKELATIRDFFEVGKSTATSSPSLFNGGCPFSLCLRNSAIVEHVDPLDAPDIRCHRNLCKGHSDGRRTCPSAFRSRRRGAARHLAVDVLAPRRETERSHRR